MDEASQIRQQRSTSTKWHKFADDVLPAWIADMDLGIAGPIRDAIITCVESGDLGYPSLSLQQNLLDAFSDRYLEKYSTPLDPDLALVSTDVVQSVFISVLTLTEPGDGVIVQTPIYPPFLDAVINTGRTLRETPMLRTDSSWEINFDELELVASEPSTNLFLMCSPHNPTGRVFTQAEQVKIADICSRNNVVVITDEIHSDIVYQPAFHIPFASISPEFASNVITMTSATKSFNIAGLRCAVTHFGSSELKSRYETYPYHVRGSVSNLGMLATTIAWSQCDDWLDGTLSQLGANRKAIASHLESNDSGIGFVEPEGTYLAWLDFRHTAFVTSPESHLLEKGKIALSSGADFGTTGIGWARLNFATTPDILSQILHRMTDCLKRDST